MITRVTGNPRLLQPLPQQRLQLRPVLLNPTLRRIALYKVLHIGPSIGRVSTFDRMLDQFRVIVVEFKLHGGLVSQATSVETCLKV